VSEAFESWCILELMGHVRMAGRVTEEERFGVKMGRIEVPIAGRPCVTCKGRGRVADPGEDDDVRTGKGIEDYRPCEACDGHGEVGQGWTTVYFGGQSIYRMTPTTEDVARAVAKGSQPEPVHRWELPKPERAPAVLDGSPDEDPDDEDDEIPY
jgi:hypothetical protein